MSSRKLRRSVERLKSKRKRRGKPMLGVAMAVDVEVLTAGVVVVVAEAAVVVGISQESRTSLRALTRRVCTTRGPASLSSRSRRRKTWRLTTTTTHPLETCERSFPGCQ